MSTAQTNSWLKAQRKSDLVELADQVGFKKYDGLKKSDLEAALDSFIAENSASFANRDDLAGYFSSRSRTLGSPVKREKEALKDTTDSAVKVVKKRASKALDAITDDEPRGSSTALVQTPGRSLSQVAARIPLPATPADVANAVDRSTLAMRKRVSSVYQDSGITEGAQVTRNALSTVTSVLFLVSAVELYHIREGLLPSRFAFNIPAVSLLGTSDYPVYIPDMFLVLTSSFWSPAFAWAFTSIFLPSLFGYFINLSSANNTVPKTRSRAHEKAEHVVDPLTFSIVKALVSYLVYAQGVTFGGLLSEPSIARLSESVYGGWQGMLVGTAITGLFSIYDAVLRN